MYTCVCNAKKWIETYTGIVSNDIIVATLFVFNGNKDHWVQKNFDVKSGNIMITVQKYFILARIHRFPLPWCTSRSFFMYIK